MKKIYTFSENTSFSFAVFPPFFLPFYNQWGTNVYRKYEPFTLNPFTLKTTSTSGSPVVLAGDFFCGFLYDTDGEFSFDGCGTLTVTAPAGQALYVDECCPPYTAWEDYNATVYEYNHIPAPQPEKFWTGLEYCTWVDQKNQAEAKGEKDVWKPLTEEYVYNYMRRVEKIGLPAGKLTIDDGWDMLYTPEGRRIIGEWEPDRTKFPHMEQLVRDMTHEGFFPGLWLAPFLATQTSKIAQAHPEILGTPFSGASENATPHTRMNLLPNEEVLVPYYTEIFGKYIDMGFRKFKLDMSYGPKRDMKGLLQILHKVIKSLDPTVEIESHIPDIFVSRYCDTVRINDVSFDEEGKWRGITWEHYKVCKYSAAGRTLNLDHIGTNTPVPTEKDFFAHADLLLSLTGGFPCVSLLPDFFGEEAEKRYAEKVWAWVNKP